MFYSKQQKWDCKFSPFLHLDTLMGDLIYSSHLPVLPLKDTDTVFKVFKVFFKLFILVMSYCYFFQKQR